MCVISLSKIYLFIYTVIREGGPMDSGCRSVCGLETSPSLLAVTLSLAEAATWLSLPVEC